MAFKFLDTSEVLQALGEHENLARERFQHLCDQFYEILKRLPCAQEAADVPITTAAAQAPISETTAPVTSATVEMKSLPQTANDAAERVDWSSVLLGEAIAADSQISSVRANLMAAIVAGDRLAMALTAQLLLFRSAPAERYPQLLKDVGEAYYRWHAEKSDEDHQLESALIAWLAEACAGVGMMNVIERVQPGDRFDPIRHQAPQAGLEVVQVHGWVVLRDNGKVYTRASVTTR